MTEEDTWHLHLVSPCTNIDIYKHEHVHIYTAHTHTQYTQHNFKQMVESSNHHREQGRHAREQVVHWNKRRYIDYMSLHEENRSQLDVSTYFQRTF